MTKHKITKEEKKMLKRIAENYLLFKKAELVRQIEEERFFRLTYGDFVFPIKK